MPSYFRHIVHFLLVAMMMGGSRATLLGGWLWAIGNRRWKQKIDVNAFDIELFYNKNTLACELQKYLKIRVMYLVFGSKECSGLH